MSATADEFYLPEELVVTNILSRLPVKSLIRFKSVSKRMHSIVSSPYFARLHLSKSTSLSNKSQHLLINHKTCFLSFDFDSFGGGDNWDCSPFNDEGDIVSGTAGVARIISSNFHIPQSHIFVVGSCNGLVCLKTKFCFFYIWNPTILVFRKIPFPKSQKKHDVVWGFHYVESVNDYKVVRICQNRPDNKKIIQVFSLSENRWTFSQEEIEGYGERPRLTGLGVIVNNVTYRLCKGYDTENRQIRWWVIGYDWVAGKLIRVPLPVWQEGGLLRPPFMYVMEGRLCAYWRVNDGQIIEGGMFVTGSWMRLPQLGQSIVVHSMCYCHQGMPNITNKSRFAIKSSRDRDTLLLIDPTQETPEDVHMLRIPSSRNVVNYTQSLISPFVTNSIL